MPKQYQDIQSARLLYSLWIRARTTGNDLRMIAVHAENMFMKLPKLLDELEEFRRWKDNMHDDAKSFKKYKESVKI